MVLEIIAGAGIGGYKMVILCLSRQFIRFISTSGPYLRSSFGLSLKDSKVQKYLKEFNHNHNSSSTSHYVQGIVEEIHKKQEELDDLAIMVKGSTDSDLKCMAEKDKINIEKGLESLEEQFFSALITESKESEIDSDEMVLEISAGIGGQEAMLFAQDLFTMYQNYSFSKGWDFEVMNLGQNDLGGLRMASATISGPGSFSQLKYEGGVHRVQRVPKTEKAGRIHTSTVAVAILPTPTDLEVVIKPGDLREEVKRASGAGGQHVNTTESAVRVVHIPTGLAVDCQMERSQIQNRVLAHKMLRAKLYERMQSEAIVKRNAQRKLQVGLSARSDKIRTYNFVQDRVTDHRISFTSHNLEGILGGQSHFGELVEKLLEFEKIERLHSVFDNQNQDQTQSQASRKGR